MKTMITPTPIGPLSIETDNNRLITINFLYDDVGHRSLHSLSPTYNTLQTMVIKQLNAYFKNPNFQFTIPLKIKGTEFQKKVWQALQEIPVGKTATYGDLAKKLHSSPRAIGNACRANPSPIIIPCHRVVAKNSLGGFGGKTAGKNIEVKKWLLKHESKP